MLGFTPQLPSMPSSLSQSGEAPRRGRSIPELGLELEPISELSLYVSTELTSGRDWTTRLDCAKYKVQRRNWDQQETDRRYKILLLDSKHIKPINRKTGLIWVPAEISCNCKPGDKFAEADKH